MKFVKPRTETIVLIVVIAALLLYLVLRDPDRVNYRLPDLPTLTASGISRVEIQRADDAIALENKDGRWLIQPQGFVADPAKIKAIVGVISALKLTALVSESRNYFPYGLDKENTIRVKAFNNDQLLREFSIGSAAATYSHTHVALVNDPRVYHAQGAFRGDFEQKTDGLRDKTVLQFDKNEIAAMEIHSGGEKVLFTKHVKPIEVRAGEKQPQGQAPAPNVEASWLMADGKPGNRSELNGIIEQTSQLTCEQFIEGKTKADFKEPVYTVLLKGNKDFTLSIYAKAEKEISYAAVSSESPNPFLLGSYQAENIMKKLADLKKEAVAAN